MVGKSERTPRVGRIIKPVPRNKFTRQSVIRMLSVMEASHKRDNDTGPSTTSAQTAGANSETSNSAPNNGVQEFLTSGRTGRRNALPDILGQHASFTSSDLPSRLASLSTNDSSESVPEQNAAPGSSKS